MDDGKNPKSGALVVRLLRLPNLETLYFNSLPCEPDDGSRDYENENDSDGSNDYEQNEWIICEFPSHSASVKHLFFEGLSYALEAEFLEWFCNAPRKLRTVTFSNSGPDAGNFISESYIAQELKRIQTSSLESLMWYSFDSLSAHGAECSVVDLEGKTLDRFRKLK
jgi:hypothetical protein